MYIIEIAKNNSNENIIIITKIIIMKKNSKVLEPL